MTIVESLKKLYIAMGGNAEDVANFSLNPELIDAIADLAANEQKGGVLLHTVEENGTVRLDIKAKDLYELAQKTPISVMPAIVHTSGQYQCYFYALTQAFAGDEHNTGYVFHFTGDAVQDTIEFEAFNDDDYPTKA